MRVVLCDGCFDVLHIGHHEHLQSAKDMGDWLIVALTLDENVNKGPGRPVNTWHDRAALLRALRYVDEVIPASNALEAIRLVKPALFVKGIDYADGKHWTEDVEAICRSVGTEIRFTNCPKRSIKDIILRASA